MWQSSFEQYRVDPILGVEERHVAVHLHEEVDTFVPLLKVGNVNRQGIIASWTSESPT